MKRKKERRNETQGYCLKRHKKKAGTSFLKCKERHSKGGGSQTKMEYKLCEKKKKCTNLKY